MEDIQIIYEDANFMAVNKPPYLTVDGLEEWLRHNKKINLPRAGIVHRLDKGTSGLLLVAKTNEALVGLKKIFKERRIEKTYLALVEGDLPSYGEIKMPILRSKYKFATFKVSEDGKEAETRFKVIAKYRREGKKIYSFVEIKPKTGRTHQIRVHFAYMGWFLVGDWLYGGERGLGRPFLHAYNLKFINPEGGREVDLTVDFPADLEQELTNYERL